MKQILTILLLSASITLSAQITGISSDTIVSAVTMDQREIKIYPNPTNSGSITIEGLDNYIIVDLLGRKKEMPLTTGVYFIVSDKKRIKIVSL